MKKTHKIIAVLLAAVTFMTVLSGCGGTASGSAAPDTAQSEEEIATNTEEAQSTNDADEPPYTIVMATIPGINYSDEKIVEDTINEYLQEKINVKLDLLLIEGSSYEQQINLMQSGNEKLDLLLIGDTGNYSSLVNQNKLYPLNDLLAQYGQPVIDVMGKYLNGVKINGEVYAIPTYRDMASGYGMIIDPVVVEELGLDLSGVDTLEEVGEVLQVMHDAYPDKIGIVSPTSALSVMSLMYEPFDELGDGIGVLNNRGLDNLTVVNKYETEEYREALEYFRDFWKKGYILEDMSTNADTAVLLLGGQVLCCAVGQKPGIDVQGAPYFPAGRPTGTVMIGNAFMATKNVTNVALGVPAACERPDKVMEFLNLLYTDPYVVNTLEYGIEGTHYVKTDQENVITYAEGYDAATVPYGIPGFYLGNQLITYTLPDQDPNLWEQMKIFNDEADVSLAFGFNFDPENVKAEYAAVQNVISTYAIPLENGEVDIDSVLPKFIDELKAAGIDKIIEEKQTQLDKWAIDNK